MLALTQVPVGTAGPPRVLIVSPQPFYEDRGTPIAVGQLAAALGALGCEVDLLAYPVGHDVNLTNLRIFRSPRLLGITSVPVGLSLRKVLLDFGMLLSLRARMREGRYIAVHALEEMALPAIWYCKRKGIPLIYDMQSSLPDQLRNHAFLRAGPMQRLLKAVERYMVRNATAVVCSAGLGNHVRRIDPTAKVVEWFYAGQAAPTDMPDGAEVRRRIGIAADTPVVMYTGTFEPYQGLDLFVAAMPMVLAATPNAKFVLVGATAANDLASNPTATALREAGRLIVLPRQPRASVPGLLAAADILVSPRAFGDNVPLKIFDYTLARKPIVATDIPAHRSLLTDETAVLVDKQPAAIAAGIIRLFRDPSLRDKVSDAALQHAGRSSQGEAFSELVRALYDTTLRQTPHRGSPGALARTS